LPSHLPRDFSLDNARLADDFVAISLLVTHTHAFNLIPSLQIFE
jgi:hypothetical protein